MDPLLMDIPDQIETERLIIRCPRPREGAAVNAAIADSIVELKRWMPWAQTMPTVEDSEIHTRRAHAKFHAREDLAYRGWLKDQSTYVVGGGLHRIDWSVPKFEIGYWVRTPLTGRGYATELVTALTRLAFDSLKAQRVEIRCDDRNHRSGRVAERAGFQLEGILRNDCREVDGSLRSTRIYSRIAP